jgi:hypothetical protein
VSLGENRTLKAGVILSIDSSTNFTIPSGVTFTNKGTIANYGIIYNNTDGTINNNGTINNFLYINNYNGTIDNTSGGAINNYNFIGSGG